MKFGRSSNQSENYNYYSDQRQQTSGQKNQTGASNRTENLTGGFQANDNFQRVAESDPHNKNLFSHNLASYRKANQAQDKKADRETFRKDIYAMFFGMQELCKGLASDHDEDEREKRLNMEREKEEIMGRLANLLTNKASENTDFMGELTSKKDLRFYATERSELDRKRRYDDIIFNEKMDKNQDDQFMQKLSNQLDDRNLNQLTDKYSKNTEKLRQVLRMTVVRELMSKEERVRAIMYRNKLEGNHLDEKDIQNLVSGKSQGQIMSDKNTKADARNRYNRDIDDDDEHSVATHRKKLKNLEKISCVDEGESLGGGLRNIMRGGMDDGISMVTATVDCGPETAKRGQENRFMAGKMSTTAGTAGSKFGGGYGNWAGNKQKGKVVVNKGREKKNDKMKKEGHGGNQFYISHMKQNTYAENLATQFQYKSPISNL